MAWPGPPAAAPRIPGLLISVRTATEALTALSAGVEILDIKEPSRGPLGRADNAVLRAIITARDATAPAIPVSAALGELHDYDTASPPEPIALPAAGLAFVKLGLAGMAEVPDWPARWQRLRASLIASLPEQGRAPQWVGVAYADAATAHAPDPATVIDAAINAGCAGVLMDTWCKRSPGLLAQLGMERLTDLATRIRSAGLFCAVAGRLQQSDLPRLADLPIDIIALRSAACLGSDRNAPLCPERIAALRATLQQRRTPSAVG